MTPARAAAERSLSGAMAREIFSERIAKAINFAAKAHHNQFRRTDPNLPYITHCFAVGFMIAQAGFPEDVVIAAILHDLIEDTKTTLGDVKKDFGPVVANIVDQLSDKPGLEFSDRIGAQIAKLERAPDEVKFIKAADILHNVYSKLLYLEEGGRINELSQYFEGMPGEAKTMKETTSGYKRRLEAIRKDWNNPIIQEAEHYVKKLEGKFNERN